MYIGYLRDRKELGFKVIVQKKKINQQKRKKIIIAVVIWLRILFPNEAFANQDLPSPQAYEVSLQALDEFNTRELEPLLTIRGGDNDYSHTEQIETSNSEQIEINDLEMQRLVKSLEEKCQGTDLSPNKCAQYVYTEVIKPELSHERFLNLLLQLDDLYMARLEAKMNQAPSGEAKLAPSGEAKSAPSGKAKSAPSSEAKSREQVLTKAHSKSSSIFAEAFQTLQYGVGRKTKISVGRSGSITFQMSKRFPNMPDGSDTFSERLLPSGLSTNHKTLLPAIQDIEWWTRYRRAHPLYPSQALANEVPGKTFVYSKKQLEKKRHHLSDFDPNYDEEFVEKNVVSSGKKLHRLIEEFLQTPNLIRSPNATFNKQEPVYIIADDDSKRIVAFETNPLYDKFNNNHFVSAYRINPTAFDEFVKSGNIGLSKKERDERKKKDLLKPTSAFTKAILEAKKAREKDLYQTIPQDVRVNNKLLKEVEEWTNKAAKDPTYILTDKQKKGIARVAKYKLLKEEYDASHPETSNASSSETYNASYSETYNVSYSETSNESYSETYNKSYSKTYNASYSETFNTSDSETSNESYSETSNTSDSETSYEFYSETSNTSDPETSDEKLDDEL